MLKLGVNIDHVAAIRQARYRAAEAKGEPDPIQAAIACEAAGCHGITVHLREDRRHIQDGDVWRLKQTLQIPLNLEMANTPEMVEIAAQLRPASVCIVPEKREELTTEGGLAVAGALPSLAQTVDRLQSLGVEVSLFIDPNPAQVAAAAKTKARAVELHTGDFAEAFKTNPSDAEREIRRISTAASQGNQLSLKVNAGHGLNYQNIAHIRKVPHLAELNIGHSIVSRSIVVGLGAAVREMLRLLQPENRRKDCD